MQIEDDLRQFLRELSLDDNLSIDLDDNLLEQGVIDSLGLIRLMQHLQTKFGVQLDADEIVPENLQTLRRMVAFVEKKRGRR